MSAANCPEGKRGPSGALGAAQSDPQGGWEASRATGRELCDTGHPVLEDSPEGATAGRSPRRIATWAAFGVAVPRAFFGTFFRFERKYYPRRGGSPTTRAGVGASIPTGGRSMRLRAHQRAFLGANNRRGSHCRALRLLFA